MKLCVLKDECKGNRQKILTTQVLYLAHTKARQHYHISLYRFPRHLFRNSTIKQHLLMSIGSIYLNEACFSFFCNLALVPYT